MSAKIAIPLLVIPVLLLAAACGPGQQPDSTHTPTPPPVATPTAPQSATPTPAPPTPTPTKPAASTPTATPAPASAVEVVLAPIDGARLGLTPDGAYLEVASGLPNGCQTFRDFRLKYSEGVLHVTVENNTPADPGLFCTQVYGMVTTTMPLQDVSDMPKAVPCAVYDVEINGNRYALQAEGDSSACTAGNLPVTLGQEVKLGLGQAAAYEKEGLAVRFLRVAGDSRCPTGVVCVWAGEAKVVVEATLKGQPAATLELTLGGDGVAASTKAGGYSVRIVGLEPYPTAAGVDPKAYAATLVVS
ncbi:MAG: hypothetical protein HY681_11590 [Chloroflexi bacterium]|nr:hypothetical protein [Chloroflexota bacterium]